MEIALSRHLSRNTASWNFGSIRNNSGPITVSAILPRKIFYGINRSFNRIIVRYNSESGRYYPSHNHRGIYVSGRFHAPRSLPPSFSNFHVTRGRTLLLLLLLPQRYGIITLLGTITRFPFMWPSSRVRLNRRYVRHCRDICLVIKSGGDKYALKPRYPRGNFARNTSPRSLKPPSELFFIFFFFVFLVYDVIRVQYTGCMRKEKLVMKREEKGRWFLVQSIKSKMWNDWLNAFAIV